MKTLKLRIKDKHTKVLTELATQVNFVWNYINAAKNILRIGRDTLVGGIPPGKTSRLDKAYEYEFNSR